MWSAGVILYILVTAIPPFDGINDRAIIETVRKGFYTFAIPEMKTVSGECKDLIKKLLLPDKERLTIQEIFNHPWMKMELSNSPLLINYEKLREFKKYTKVTLA